MVSDSSPSTEQRLVVRKPKLLKQLREVLRSRHYSRRTEQTYCQWVKRFVFCHNLRHPVEMSESEINVFLTHLAGKEKVSARNILLAKYTFKSLDENGKRKVTVRVKEILERYVLDTMSFFV